MWIPLADLLPPAGEPVQTQDKQGNTQTLVRRGSHWYTEDGKQLNPPTHWKY